jgi:hypothetical protein
MINPQKGIDLMNNTSIIIRILFAVTIFQQEEGTFVEVMDPEGSQCIQRNNTLKVKTPSLIVVIVISLTYISKSLLHYK